MNKKQSFILWGVLFAVCAGLGFVPQPEGALKVLMGILSLGFFAVGGWILWSAGQRKDLATVALIRSLSLASLVLTLVMLIGNFLSVFTSKWLGDLLHYMLIVVYSPMLCAPSWAMSLFLWACLMVASHKILTKKSR